MRSPATRATAIAFLGCAILLGACQGDPTGVRRDLHPTFSVGNGNSDAAHLCQNGGYANVLRNDGTGFTNTGDCVSYAARGGQFFHEITFSNISLGACNSITFGYTVGGVSTDVDTKPYGCFSQTFSDVTILAPIGSTVQVYLKDNTCNATFTQDSQHALVTGTNPTQIAITDAGGFCEAPSPTTPRPPTNGVGNLNVTETIL